MGGWRGGPSLGNCAAITRLTMEKKQLTKKERLRLPQGKRPAGDIYNIREALVETERLLKQQKRCNPNCTCNAIGAYFRSTAGNLLWGDHLLQIATAHPGSARPSGLRVQELSSSSTIHGIEAS